MKKYNAAHMNFSTDCCISTAQGVFVGFCDQSKLLPSVERDFLFYQSICFGGDVNSMIAEESFHISWLLRCSEVNGFFQVLNLHFFSF